MRGDVIRFVNVIHLFTSLATVLAAIGRAVSNAGLLRRAGVMRTIWWVRWWDRVADHCWFNAGQSSTMLSQH